MAEATNAAKQLLSTSESTMTSKGQVTVPADVRQALEAQAGTKLVWHKVPGNAYLVRSKHGSVKELVGMLKPAAGIKASIDDMNPWKD